MFTGIIEEIGTVERIQQGAHSAVLQIRAGVILEDLRVGDSVAVNGVCLTAACLLPQGFQADVMHETLNRSTLGALKPGSAVNLERAMPANGRFGGHIVAGHVDGTGTVQKIRQDGNAVWYTVQAPPEVLRYVVEKGSVALDGISLTVAQVGPDWFAVSAIPHTAAVTTLGRRRLGDRVNLECDMIGKYVEKLLQPRPAERPPNGLTREFLARNGII